MAKKRNKWKLGDIVVIPLSDGHFAFARMMNEGDYEIYRLLSSTASPSLGEITKSGVAFYQSGTDKPVNNGAFSVFGNIPFVDDNSAWLPPQATSYDRDSGTWFTSTPRVMVRGDSRPATEQEVIGLDTWSYCADAEAIVNVIEDRLLKGNHDKYKVRAS